MYDFPNVINTPFTTNENACTIGYFNKRSNNPSFIDLRPLQDDKKILRNPHKGWYWHYIDNGYKRNAYRADHDHTDRLERFPGLNHLYLRFDWADIEKEKGVYDWSYIDSIMEEWSKYDYRFSMRFVTYEGDPNIPATPNYVYKEGARGYLLPDGKIEPDYGDPVFLENLERFLEEAGRRFNGHPLIELIDLGTFGTWGEGHTAFGTDTIHPSSVIKKHIDLSKKYFPDTFIILNDDHINHRWHRDVDENLELIEYAAKSGLGLEDDSVCVSGYADNCGYNSLRTPWLFDMFCENAPTVLEFEHYHCVAPHHFRGGFPFIDAMQRTKCTFAGFHGYPVPWLEREPYLTEYAANRLGYWYLPDSAEISVSSDKRLNGKLNIENRGFAKAYYKFDLKLKLTGDRGEFIFDIACDNRTWAPGCISSVDLMLDLSDVQNGDYKVSIGLFEGSRPIETGMKAAEKGYYPISRLTV